MKITKTKLKEMIKEEIQNLNEGKTVKDIFKDKKMSITIYVRGDLGKIKKKFKTAEETTAAGSDVVIPNYKTNMLDTLNNLEKDLKSVGAKIVSIDIMRIRLK